MNEEIMFQTKDKVLIFGNWLSPENPIGAVLLLHMMPADKSSWRVLQDELSKRRIASLAIDLRGHGKSVSKGTETIDYKTFSDFEHQDSMLDVESSLQFLRKKGFNLKQIVAIGASIGANLALETVVENDAMPAVVLLSPGEDYRGIKTFPLAEALDPNQSVFAVASAGDDQKSHDAARAIVEKARSAKKEFKSFTSAGHGTNIFLQDQNLPGLIADWVAGSINKQTA